MLQFDIDWNPIYLIQKSLIYPSKNLKESISLLLSPRKHLNMLLKAENTKAECWVNKNKMFLYIMPEKVKINERLKRIEGKAREKSQQQKTI